MKDWLTGIKRLSSFLFNRATLMPNFSPRPIQMFLPIIMPNLHTFNSKTFSETLSATQNKVVSNYFQLTFQNNRYKMVYIYHIEDILNKSIVCCGYKHKVTKILQNISCNVQFILIVCDVYIMAVQESQKAIAKRYSFQLNKLSNCTFVFCFIYNLEHYFKITQTGPIVIVTGYGKYSSTKTVVSSLKFYRA